MPSPFQSYGRINVNEVENMRLVIDNNTLEKYEQFYFRLHPKATKRPIDKPIDDNEASYDECFKTTLERFHSLVH